MSRRIFDGQLAEELAGEDTERYERLRDTARAFVGLVREGLVRDGEVRIHGFGTFRLRRSPARTSYNPRTGERTTLTPRNRVLFRPAKALRERIEPAPAPVTVAEPRPSREAVFAAGPEAPHLAPVPAVPASRERERTARVRATGATPKRAETPEPMGSREAMLAGAAATPTRPAGALGALEPVSRGASVSPAQQREPGSREAILAAGASGSGARIAAADRGAAGPSAGEARAVEPGRPGDGASAASEKGPRMGRVDAQGDAPNEGAGAGPDAGGDGDAAKDKTGGRGSGGFWAAVALAVLLLALALWLLWPRPQEQPVTADAGGTGGGDIAQAVADGESAAETAGETGSAAEADDAGAGSGSDETAAEGSEDTTGQATGEAAGDGAAGEDEAGLPDVASAGATVGGDQSGEQAQQRPLHGAAAAGATRTPPERPDDTGTATASGTAPASPEQIEAAGATSAQDADTGGEAFSGEPFFEGREYTVAPGDTLWGLADRYYVNPFFWPHIWNNNDELANPDRISVDQLLWLPTLQGEPESLTAADRRSIAQGYLQLYRFFKHTGDGNPGYALVGVRFFDPAVLPERLRGSAAVKPSTALAAAFEARLEARFGGR